MNTIKDGARDQFARYFEAFFPAAIQQTGAIVAGQFLERDNPSAFSWIRVFRDLDDRARANAALYYGPVWNEHRARMNRLMIDSDNVLLLRPLSAERGVAIFPAVDPVQEGAGAQGVAVAQIFPIRDGAVDAFVRHAEATFAGYPAAGAREAGVLVTLDEPNNFPQLPVRTDGPYLVWLGLFEDDETRRARFAPLENRALQSLAATDWLRGEPESGVLDPTPRSRLRWRLPG